MKLIIEARVESEEAGFLREPIRLAVVGRDHDDLEHLGFSLEEGRALMAAAQSALVSNQATQWLATQDYCRRCFVNLRGAVSVWGTHIDGLSGIDDQPTRCQAVCKEAADAMDPARRPYSIADPSSGTQ